MRFLILVVLLGIDGAGKSTVAQSLVDHVRLRGEQAILLPNFAGRRSITAWCLARGSTPPPQLADIVETAIRVFNVLVSHWRARRYQGLVVMDRHLHCQLAIRSVRGLRRGRLLPWLIRVLPQPDAIVIVDIAPELALERIERRGTDQESLEYLREFWAAYRGLPEYTSFVSVDAGGSSTETTAAVEELLTRLASAPDPEQSVRTCT